MRLHSEYYGDSAGQPLVLLHGWGMHSGVWQPLLESLSGYSVTLIDLPGLGRSAGVMPPSYTLDAVTDLLQEVAPEQAIWLGWSLGGIVAMAFAQRFPERVAKLITLATSPCFVQRSDWSEGMDPETYQGFEQSLSENPSKTLQRFNMLQVQGSTTARADSKLLKQVLAQTELPPVENLEQSLALLKADYRKLYSSISLPTLHILCQLDSLAPQSIAAQLPAFCEADQVVLAEQSHVPFLSNGPLLAAEMEAWL